MTRPHWSQRLEGAILEPFPRLLIASHKGFLSGPYESRPALDEVVQMLTGLAYMTGSREKPMRAGASVNDIMGGLFGAMGLLAMLHRRETTGKGGRLRVGLFENSLFLVAQHIAQFQVTGKPVPPMSQRQHAWPIYDIFTSADDIGVFVAVTTDTAWRRFCESFQLTELLEDPRLDTTVRRIEERPSFVPKVAECLNHFTAADLEARLEGLSIPFARVHAPEELLDDPHVNRSGGLARVKDLHGRDLRIPALPIELDGGGAAPAESVAPVGADNAQLFAELGFGPGEIRQLETAMSKSA